jgi:hypothetical protein
MGFLVLFVFTDILAENIFWSDQFYYNAQSPKYANDDLDSGTIIQCLFLRSKLPQADAGLLVPVVVPVIAIVGEYSQALFQLYVPPPGFSTPNGYSTGRVMDRVAGHWIRLTMGLPWPDFDRIVYKAGADYDHQVRTQASRWHILETYQEAYLSQIPLWIFQFAYGTWSTVIVIWSSDVVVSDELKVMSFGQVVATGLLLLPILAFIQILNSVSLEQHRYEAPDEEVMTTEGARPQSMLYPQENPLQDRVVPHTQLRPPKIGMSHSNRISDALQQANSVILTDAIKSAAQDNSHSDAPGPRFSRMRAMSARGIGITCITICVLATAVLVSTSLTGSWDGYYAFIGIYVPWLVLGFALRVRRFMCLTRLMKAECEARKQQDTHPSITTQASAVSSSVPIKVDANAVGPTSTAVSLSPGVADPAAAADAQAQIMAVSRTSRDDEFPPPGRQDTEADIGLVPLRKRRTNGM